MHFPPIIQDFTHEVYRKSIFIKGQLGNYSKRRLLYDPEKMANLLGFHLIPRIILHKPQLQLKTTLDSTQPIFYIFYHFYRVKFLHHSAGILRQDQESRENSTPMSTVLRKVYKKEYISDELINQQYFKMCFLIPLIEYLHHLPLRKLIKLKSSIVMQIADCFLVEISPSVHPMQQLLDYGVVGSHHRQEIEVAIHLIGEDRKGGGVAVEEAEGTDKVSLPLAVAVSHHRQQLGEVVSVHPIVLEHTSNQEHQPHPVFLEIVE